MPRVCVVGVRGVASIDICIACSAGHGTSTAAPAGFVRPEDIQDVKIVAKIPLLVRSGISASVYAYTRQSTRQNLYRIPLS